MSLLLAKRSAPAALRNREPILQALRHRLPARALRPGVAAPLVLEIASGTGEHAVHLCRALPELRWQPTDVDDGALASAAAWRAESALPNLLAPIALDVSRRPWPVAGADAVFCANMVHIAPWSAAEGLFAGAGELLPAGGALFTYGPYRFHGSFTAPSNAAFDDSLRQRDARWGVRDVADLTPLAASCGLELEETLELPANNHILVFRKRGAQAHAGR